MNDSPREEASLTTTLPSVWTSTTTDKSTHGIQQKEVEEGEEESKACDMTLSESAAPRLLQSSCLPGPSAPPQYHDKGLRFDPQTVEDLQLFVAEKGTMNTMEWSELQTYLGVLEETKFHHIQALIVDALSTLSTNDIEYLNNTGLDMKDRLDPNKVYVQIPEDRQIVMSTKRARSLAKKRGISIVAVRLWMGKEAYDKSRKKVHGCHVISYRPTFCNTVP